MSPQRLLVCKSQDFQVDYSINPWMKPGTNNAERAVSQWQDLINLLGQFDAEIMTAEFPLGSPQELIWTRDAFQLIKGQIVLANFKHEVRRKETPYYRAWFEQNGYKTVTATATFEGGNTVPHQGVYYIGTGFRSTPMDCMQLASQLEIEVISLEVTSNDFFHIDLAFLSLDTDNAFYFPPAFTAPAQQILKSRVANLHELTEQEMRGYCANSITIGNDAIVQSGNPTFKAKLEALGKTVHEIDVSEFKNIGGGGIHCLTNVLE